jgi:diguanylate cyclase
MLQTVFRLFHPVSQALFAHAGANTGFRTGDDNIDSRLTYLERRIEQLSAELLTDELTQVANRRGLDHAFVRETARSQRALRRQQRLAIAMIDLDDFKAVNDTFGHDAGDSVLRNAGQVLKRELRPVDTLARTGGEEFVVLIPDSEIEAAQNMLERLLNQLQSQPAKHDEFSIRVTFSAGVTMWQPGETLAAAIRRADQAAYAAKAAGKACVRAQQCNCSPFHQMKQETP